MYFEAKIKYAKIDERSGKEKTVTEPYLVDAVSFTECESRITEYLKQFISGDFQVVSEKTTKIEEVHRFDEDGNWFKCIVSLTDSDEKTGKEKSTNCEIVINANDMKQARERAEEVLKGIIIPYSIKELKETKIVEVYEYSNEN